MSRPSPPLLASAIGGSILAISTAAILVAWSEASPLAVSFHRLLYATLLLLPFAFFFARRELMALSPKDWAWLSLVGAVLALHFAAWITSLRLTSVSSSVFLVTLHPAAVAIVSHRMFGEGVSRMGFLGILLALAGGVVITLGDAQQGTNPLLGDLLALLGAAAAAAYFLAGRNYRRRMGLLAYVVPVYASCTAFLAILLFLLPAPFGGPFTGYPLKEHLLFLALALFPMLLGHTVLNWALKYVTAPVIATTILGEPIGSTLLAALLLSQTPTAWGLAGGALVLIGIATVALTQGTAKGAATDTAPG